MTNISKPLQGGLVPAERRASGVQHTLSLGMEIPATANQTSSSGKF